MAIIYYFLMISCIIVDRCIINDWHARITFKGEGLHARPLLLRSLSQMMYSIYDILACGHLGPLVGMDSYSGLSDME